MHSDSSCATILLYFVLFYCKWVSGFSAVCDTTLNIDILAVHKQLFIQTEIFGNINSKSQA